MPRLTVWTIRASLIYLLLGFTFGGLLLFTKGLPWLPGLWILLPAHIEFVLFGWTVQMIMGMAFWILPRFPRPPIRGNETLAWAAFLLINTGIGLVALASLGFAGSGLTLTGRLAEIAGGVTFAAHAWPRIKGFGDQRPT
jgi:cbb3-type cytochrome oxidase subunit 1